MSRSRVAENHNTVSGGVAAELLLIRSAVGRNAEDAVAVAVDVAVTVDGEGSRVVLALVIIAILAAPVTAAECGHWAEAVSVVIVERFVVVPKARDCVADWFENADVTNRREVGEWRRAVGGNERERHVGCTFREKSALATADIEFLTDAIPAELLVKVVDDLWSENFDCQLACILGFVGEQVANLFEGLLSSLVVNFDVLLQDADQQGAHIARSSVLAGLHLKRAVRGRNSRVCIRRRTAVPNDAQSKRAIVGLDSGGGGAANDNQGGKCEQLGEHGVGYGEGTTSLKTQQQFFVCL